MTQRVFNFSAGPAVLPEPVLREAQEHLVCHPAVGASILEISHRSAFFLDVLEEAKSNLRRLLKIPEGYHVLFLPGGATLQFSMAPTCFLPAGKTAAYVSTGSWAKKAVTEARKIGSVAVAWDGSADNFTRVPKPSEIAVEPDAAYCHFTANETIQGVEFVNPPVADVPLICDMSSNILSRPIDVSRYALIYAGAQKNAGPAGVTLVVIRDDMLEKVPEHLPMMLDYRLLAEQNSSLNTPPVFAIYIVMLVTRWLQNDMGGLEGIAERNQMKARLLYEVIDHSGGFYNPHAAVDSRSLMNVTFRLPSDVLQKKFLSQAAERGLTELKGHRSVGGIRASIYNAMPVEGVQALRDFMLEFRTDH